MRIDDFLAPLAPAHFKGEVFGREPLHVPSDARRAAPLDWERMNALLAVRSHWSEPNIKLILNGQPVQPDFYLDEVDTLGGQMRRANPAKVNLFLAMGASLVANAIEDVSPEVRAITSMLGRHFSARVGANVYCSFKEIRAFPSHCDLHEVFALQCQGEKVWNIYENRAAMPVEQIIGDDAQKIVDSVKGRVRMQVRMRPGDLLYIPRGFYHDALASSEASLHVTFAVAFLTGRKVFQILQDLAIEDELFRRDLPEAGEDGGESLTRHLGALAERAADIIRSPRFHAIVGDWQRRLVDHDDPYRLPEQPPLDFYARTEKPAQVRTLAAGASLTWGGGALPLDGTAEAAEWLLERPAFSLQELQARFRHVDAGALGALVRRLEREGLLFAYTPSLQ